MDKEELARELIKTLEKERGVPVRLGVRIPENYDEVESFGSFNKRKIEVKKVENLDPKYEAEVSLLEGRYESLVDLRKKIMEYDALYGFYGWQGTLAERAFELVEQSFPSKEVDIPSGGKIKYAIIEGQPELLISRLSDNFGTPNMKGFENKVYEILDKHNIKYFRHRIIGTPSGVYDDRTGGGSIVIVDRTKIADVKMALLE